ncbi:hypothetical protein [Sharpea azabuensis]|uniref:hypothetical protein n=1 Tax=Sharpea azabuensis TaxID=322505 RepID=UPI00156A4371|nr:hypothetical protein [Sharpea azabuensis]
MAKLNKYANIYDKDGNLIRHVDSKTGKLEDYTLEELEELVDRLWEDKDENGNVKDLKAYQNASMVLMQYYQKYGNPHMAEILEKLKANMPKTNDKEEAIEALTELSEELKKEVIDEDDKTNTNDVAEDAESTTDIEDDATEHVQAQNMDEEYVDFEEVNEDGC